VEANITFAQAALGDEISVPTLDGTAMVRIPSGTQNGTIFRLKGKGLPDMREYGRGDEFVRVNLTVPTRLSQRQKDLLRQFQEAGGEPEASGKKSVFGGFRR